MKVLIVNEYTAVTGGVDTIVNCEKNFLGKFGIETYEYFLYHEEVLNSSKFNILSYNFKSFQNYKFNSIVKKISPDIIHFHNIYPLWGYPLWSFINIEKIKIIQHLHNFYPFCLNSFFYKQSEICLECYLNNSWMNGITNKCYNNSYVKSFFASFHKPTSHKWLSLAKNVDLFIGVSNFVVNKYIELGINQNKITQLENCVESKADSNSIIGKYVLYLGNVIEPKGVELVCKLAMKIPRISFVIAGSGRELKKLKDKYSNLNNLKFVGYVTNSQKDKIITESRFIILPTLWWETFGLIILEAFSKGKPVLTSGNGGTSELVLHNKTGIIVRNPTLQRLEFSVLEFWKNLENREVAKKYSEKCIEVFDNYSIANHAKKLIKIYEKLLK